ncbi:MAG: hypothetical protein KJ072_24220 [Verrucomicrobia bacterium]|nr:hypothetical protein [Verrucomicrobiota bacterium]
MQRSIIVIVGSVLSLWLATAAGATFRLESVESKAPEGGVTTTQVLVTETHRIALKFPDRWGVQVVSSNETLLMLEPDMRAGIELRLWPQSGQTTEELTEWLVRRLQGRLGDGVMVGQFRARSATAEGWGFDLVRALDRTTRAGMRVILVPYPGGMAEFELRAPVTEVGNYYRVLRHLVASFSPKETVGDRGRAKVPADRDR